MRDLVIGVDHWRRKFGVHDGTFAGPYLDGAPAAGIRGNEITRVDRGLEAAIYARGGDREGRVHRPLYLRIGAREVNDQLVGGLLDRHADPKWCIRARRIVGDAVAIAVILESSLAVRQVEKGGAH